MYKIIIENIEYTPTNKMAVRTLSRALSIIEWLKLNKNDFKKAAEFWGCSIQYLKKRTIKLGYHPNPKKVILDSDADQAIDIHLKIGCINDFCKEIGCSTDRMRFKMRQKNYSIASRMFVEVPNIVKVSWKDILYNKILSYKPETTTA